MKVDWFMGKIKGGATQRMYNNFVIQIPPHGAMKEKENKL